MEKRRKNYIIDLIFYGALILATQGVLLFLTQYLSHLTDLILIVKQAALVFPYWEKKYIFWDNTPIGLAIIAKLLLTLVMVFNYVPLFLVSLFTGLPIRDLRKSNKYTRLYWNMFSPIYYRYLPLVLAVWLIIPFMSNMAGFFYWLLATEQNFHTWIFLTLLFTYSITVLVLSWRNHLRAHCPECGSGIVIHKNELIVCNTCLTMFKIPKDINVNNLYDYHEEVLTKARRVYPRFREKPVPKNAEFHTLYPRDPWTQYKDTLFNREHNGQ